MNIQAAHSYSAARRRPLAEFGIALAVLALACLEAQAAPFVTYGFTGDSGVFAISCSGPGDGGLPNGNIADNRTFFKPGSDCTVDPLTSSATSSFTSGNVSASGSTQTALGWITGASTMSTDAQMSVLFPAGFTDSGWIETIQLDAAGFTGQFAQATIEINVSGTLTVCPVRMCLLTS